MLRVVSEECDVVMLIRALGDGRSADPRLEKLGLSPRVGGSRCFKARLVFIFVSEAIRMPSWSATTQPINKMYFVLAVFTTEKDGRI